MYYWAWAPDQGWPIIRPDAINRATLFVVCGHCSSGHQAAAWEDPE